MKSIILHELIPAESTESFTAPKRVVRKIADDEVPNEPCPNGADNCDAQSEPVLLPLRFIKWKVALTIYFVIGGLYGLYLFLFSAMWATVAWAIFLHVFSGFGVTAGAHRLWTHRSYKAAWPLRLILAMGQTISLQYTIRDWVQMHRVHHKYSETDADPHDARRGFFFSHIGWPIMEQHPEYLRRANEVNLDDLDQDPIVVSQHKYYRTWMFLVATLPPFLVPILFWGESINVVQWVLTFRACFTLNMTFLVNSAAHLWGNHPYDQNINPGESASVAILSLGEGWHNYHHVFPWDYKTSELGGYAFNHTTWLIDLCSRLGLAYDLKTVSQSVIDQRAQRTGDGTHPHTKTQ